MKHLILSLLILLLFAGCTTPTQNHPIIADVKAQTVGYDIDANYTRLFVTFKEPMNFDSFNTNSFSIIRNDSSTILPYTIATNDNITFTVDVPLFITASSYTITLDSTLQYLDGTPIGNTYTYTFNTQSNYADYLPPEINSSYPPEGDSNVSIFATLKFVFNEPIDTTRLEAAGITLQNGVFQDINFTYIASKTALFVTPTQPLQSDTNYTLLINSLCDSNSNCYNYALHFTTQAIDTVVGDANTSEHNDTPILDASLTYFFDSSLWVYGYYMPMSHGFIAFHEDNGSILSYFPLERNTTLLDFDINYYYNPTHKFTLESNGTHTTLYDNNFTVVAGPEHNFSSFAINESLGCFVSGDTLTLAQFNVTPDYNISNLTVEHNFTLPTLRSCDFYPTVFGAGIAYTSQTLYAFFVSDGNITDSHTFDQIDAVTLSDTAPLVGVIHNKNSVALLTLSSAAPVALTLQYDLPYEHNLSRMAMGDGVVYGHIEGTNTIAAIAHTDEGLVTLGTIDTNDTILSIRYQIINAKGILTVAHPWGVHRYDVESISTFGHQKSIAIENFGPRQKGKVLFAHEPLNHLLITAANGTLSVHNIVENNTTTIVIPDDATSIAIAPAIDFTNPKILVARGNNGIDIYTASINDPWSITLSYNNHIEINATIVDIATTLRDSQSGAYDLAVATYANGRKLYTAATIDTLPTLYYDFNHSNNSHYVSISYNADVGGSALFASTIDKRIEVLEYNSVYIWYYNDIYTQEVALDLQSSYNALFAAEGANGVEAFTCPSYSSCSPYRLFPTPGYAVALFESGNFVAGSSYDYTLFIADTLGIGSVNYRAGFYNSEVDTLHYSPAKRPVRNIVAPDYTYGKFGIFTSDGNGTIDNYNKFIPNLGI